MAVPKFQQFMLPMLELAGDGQVWRLAEARQQLADTFDLSIEQREELLPSGRQTRLANQLPGLRYIWNRVVY